MPTQSADVSGGQFGIRYASAGLTWTVLSGVDVSGRDAGVYSQFANSTLLNSGAISPGLGPLQTGVYYDPSGVTGSYVVENLKGASIAGRSGVVLDGFAGSAKIVNAGKIGDGQTAVQIGGVGAITIENTGEISGNTVGIILFADGPAATGPIIDNQGTIFGGQDGIHISGDSATTAKVTNHKGGLIESDFLAVRVFFNSAHALLFENDGKVIGYVVGGPNGDKVVNTGQIDGGIALGAGADSFQNKGKGASGNIDSGLGNDKITLGDKNDKLVFDSALDASSNVDRIKGFRSGKDKLYLDDEFFPALSSGTLASSAFHIGKSAKDSGDRVIYDKKSGAVLFDADGQGGQKAVAFATLDKNAKLKASDFVAGEYSLFA